MSTFEFDRVDVGDLELKVLEDGRREVSVIATVFVLVIDEDRLTNIAPFNRVRIVKEVPQDGCLDQAHRRVRLLAKREGKALFELVIAMAEDLAKEAA